MPYLKNAYLYFLSLRKLIFKSIKELFFSTNFYNKLLISAIPSRFFFYPNPYLLSPLLNHKSFLFKISKNEIVGMGAVITKDISENTTVIGIPGKSIDYNSDGNAINKIRENFKEFYLLRILFTSKDLNFLCISNVPTHPQSLELGIRVTFFIKTIPIYW